MNAPFIVVVARWIQQARPWDPALHIRPKVSAGGKIGVEAPGPWGGERVAVSMVPGGESPAKSKTVMDVLDILPGHRRFETLDGVNRFLHEERDSWIT